MLVTLVSTNELLPRGKCWPWAKKNYAQGQDLDPHRPKILCVNSWMKSNVSMKCTTETRNETTYKIPQCL